MVIWRNSLDELCTRRCDNISTRQRCRWSSGAEIHLLNGGQVTANEVRRDAARNIHWVICVVFHWNPQRRARAFAGTRIDRKHQICHRVGLARFESASRSCRDGKSVGDQGNNKEKNGTKCLHNGSEWESYSIIGEYARSLVGEGVGERCKRAGVTSLMRSY